MRSASFSEQCHVLDQHGECLAVAQVHIDVAFDRPPPHLLGAVAGLGLGQHRLQFVQQRNAASIDERHDAPGLPVDRMIFDLAGPRSAGAAQAITGSASSDMRMTNSPEGCTTLAMLRRLSAASRSLAAGAPSVMSSTFT
jgi:hypothetical protein